jgi:hypothetical protein
LLLGNGRVQGLTGYGIVQNHVAFQRFVGCPGLSQPVVNQRQHLQVGGLQLRVFALARQLQRFLAERQRGGGIGLNLRFAQVPERRRL